MHNFKDLTGLVSHDLTVIRREGSYRSGNARWLCQCTCGKQAYASKYDLTRGRQISCGCKRGEFISKANTRHGMCYGRTNRIWRGMRNRCYRKKNKDYHRYGGLGVTVCDSWRGSFEAFLNDMGVCPDGHSIDRIDPEKGYCKDNCKWATPIEQARNRRGTLKLEFEGEVISFAEAIERTGIYFETARSRHKNGWSLYDAVTVPVGGKRPK